MQSKQLHHGACACKEIQFSFTGEPRFVSDCVCQSCRMAHGATVVSWVGVSNEQFILKTGTEFLQWYESSPATERGFCKQCGTRLLFRSSKWSEETHMALACISEPHDLLSTGVHCAQEFPRWSYFHLPQDVGKG